MAFEFKFALFALALLIPVTVRAAPDCGVEAVAKARGEFQALYDARKFGEARDILNEVWAGCFIEKPEGEIAAAVASDLALAAHRAADSDECLQVLSDFLPGFREAERRLAALPEKQRKALTFNAQLCEKSCKGNGPGCLTARVAKAHGRLDRAEFAKAGECAFEAGDGAQALAPDLCLRMLAPRREVDLAERARARSADICPRVVLVRKGSPPREQSLPAESWLRHVDMCCAEAEIAVDPRGRIRIQPAENPPEGCLHGRRSLVAEEIYVVEGGALWLQKRTQIGVR